MIAYSIYLYRSGEVLAKPFDRVEDAVGYMSSNYPDIKYVVRDRQGRDVTRGGRDATSS